MTNSWSATFWSDKLSFIKIGPANFFSELKAFSALFLCLIVAYSLSNFYFAKWILNLQIYLNFDFNVFIRTLGPYNNRVWKDWKLSKFVWKYQGVKDLNWSNGGKTSEIRISVSFENFFTFKKMYVFFIANVEESYNPPSLFQVICMKIDPIVWTIPNISFRKFAIGNICIFKKKTRNLTSKNPTYSKNKNLFLGIIL